MSDVHSGITGEEEDLLQSSLSSAFTSASVPKAPQAPAPAPAQPQAPAQAQPSDAPAPKPLVSREEQEQWKADYDSQIHSWRAESAVARQKADDTRSYWEAVREKQKGDAAGGGSWEKVEDAPMPGPPNYDGAPVSDWPRVGEAERRAAARKGFPGSSSPADARDRVTGEPRGTHATGVHEGGLEHSQHSLSQRWEEVPSMESSFPSLSFPSENVSHTASPPRSHAHGNKYESEKTVGPRRAAAAAAAAAGAASVPPSATLSVFDSRLSRRTRALALVSSLTINLILPFVNGVMLGFGEIFARSLAARFGWRMPGGAATAVGVGAVRASQRK